MFNFVSGFAILCNVLWLCHLGSGQAKEYTTFFHVVNQRYLSRHGKATVYSPSDAEKFEIYPSGNGRSFLLTYPWTKEGNPQKTLDINGGCNLNGKVSEFSFNRATNQMWILNGDGSISSACNPNWLLITDHYGSQMVQDRNSIPQANRVWRRGTARANNPAGYFSGK